MIRVNDLMTTNPISAAADTPIDVLYALMKTNSCHQIPILKQGALMGIVTIRDVMDVLSTPLFTKGTAATIMTENPITVSAQTPAHEAAAMLTAFKFNALPVLDDGVLVGMITTSNFLNQFDSQY